jgi:integrase
MPVAQHITRRGGIYRLRCRVPSDLVPVIGRGEIHRSLATACPREARRRAHRLYGRVVEIFEGLRGMADTKEEWLAQLAAMTASDREAAIGDLFDLAAAGIREMDQERGRREKAEEAARVLGQQCGELLGHLADTVSPDKVEQIARWRDGAVALRRQRDDLQRQKEELEGSAVIGQGEAIVAALSRRLGLPLQSANTPTVSRFLGDTYTRERRLADDSHRHIVNSITLFSRITGDKRLTDYRRTDIVDYVRTLEQLSNSTGKSPEDKTATVERLLEKSAGKPTMNATTVEKHVQHVKSFFNTARRHLNFTTSDALDELFDDIDLSDFVPLPQKRKSWPIDKLNALHGTPIWQGTSSRPNDFTKRHKEGDHIYRDAYWWLPIASLWTGARLEELAQLHHEDLITDSSGIRFIHIHNEGIRRVKTTNSIRRVPVHSVLTQFGFLDLFDREKAGQRIWPELKPTGRMQKFGDTYSSHFGDYRRHCDLYVKLMDFHSLRRTFITSMRTRANVDALTVAALAGHDEELPIFERAQQTDDYTDYGIAALAAQIERLDYAAYGLDLGLIAKD